MRVAVIGAGAAGLSSARHIIASGHKCDVLESGSKLGGTWVYTDDVGIDKYGFPVNSAMYKGLRTNLPKEVMGFPDFPIPEQHKSYLYQEEILNFLNLYADYFNIIPKIKFNRHVVNISPLSNNKWNVTSVYKPTNVVIYQEYDAIMVCNGHYNKPMIPEINGIEIFKGVTLHSHQYRSADKFANQRVLVIGAGPSGMDLVLQISKVATKVVFSHRLKEPINTIYPSNVEIKQDVRCVSSEEEAIFKDGSVSKFDIIFYCTGYKYDFPFLDKSCGVTVTENHIEPLYKHMIHIEKPTICFIGIPFNVCAFQMFDLQARFYVSYLNGIMNLPSKQNMFENTIKDMKNRWIKGYSKSQAHLMGPDQSLYYQDLAMAAKTEPIDPVIVKLRDESVNRLYNDLINFRNDRYKIIDKQSFIKIRP